MPTTTRQRKFYPSVNQRLMGYIKRLPGLVAYYPLNEDSGAVVYNHAPATKGTLNGAITGATLKQDGLVGKAYSFDGVDDNVLIAQASPLPMYSNTAFAISGIFSFIDDYTGTINLFGEGNGSTGNPQYTLGIAHDGLNNRFVVFVRDDVNSVLLNAKKSTTILLPNTSYQFVWVDNNGTCSLYINGISENPTAGNWNYTRGTLTLNKTSIGALVRTGVGQVFYGKIQHMSFADSIFTTSQILKMAQIAGLV